jgi:hypothetical protein
MEMLMFIVFAIVYFPAVSVMAFIAAAYVAFLPARISLNSSHPSSLPITIGSAGLLGLVVWPFLGLATEGAPGHGVMSLLAIVYAWPLAVAFWLVLMFWAKSVNERVQ